MTAPDPADYTDVDAFEADWQAANPGGQIIQLDADDSGQIDPDSLIGPLPGVDNDDQDDEDDD